MAESTLPELPEDERRAADRYLKHKEIENAFVAGNISAEEAQEQSDKVFLQRETE